MTETWKVVYTKQARKDAKKLAPAGLQALNIQHRLVYEILAETRTVKVLRMWAHYE